MFVKRIISWWLPWSFFPSHPKLCPVTQITGCRLSLTEPGDSNSVHLLGRKLNYLVRVFEDPSFGFLSVTFPNQIRFLRCSAIYNTRRKQCLWEAEAEGLLSLNYLRWRKEEGKVVVCILSSLLTNNPENNCPWWNRQSAVLNMKRQ